MQEGSVPASEHEHRADRDRLRPRSRGGTEDGGSERADGHGVTGRGQRRQRERAGPGGRGEGERDRRVHASEACGASPRDVTRGVTAVRARPRPLVPAAVKARARRDRPADTVMTLQLAGPFLPSLSTRRLLNTNRLVCKA